MQIVVNIAGCAQGTGLKDFIERRLDSRLGSVADRLGRIVVEVADAKTPAGAVQRQCRIRAQLLPTGILVTQETSSPSVYDAVERAVDGIYKSFSRYFDYEKKRASDALFQNQFLKRVRVA